VLRLEELELGVRVRVRLVVGVRDRVRARVIFRVRV
jgi:hypothetical protein